jgi:hypothetical protein
LIHLNADGGEGGSLATASVARNVRQWRDASLAMKRDYFSRIDDNYI